MSLPGLSPPTNATPRVNDERTATGKGSRTSRSRVTQACDGCRQARSKCEPSGQDESCLMCFRLGIDCLFNVPTHKRGPLKGHTKKLEGRLSEAESILGIFQTFPNATVQNVLDELNKDPLAGRLLERVAHSPFGPFGRMRNSEDTDLRDVSDQTEERATEGLCLAWQSRLIANVHESTSGVIDDMPSVQGSHAP
ncbi:hypothetical protein SISNIDRAFT_460127 [Sistotremastrum niveocremeum HHB9708]|uniref:Zn(2)-C6 fungal-type domain-containing protein n=2 Tax=Sistotremastraceae TaxID=3402574 RepID=A0A164NV98_9AGAM|nr:hypothetical protein SISNIDRAFT_460127 [Sistotremastrum niveocremeum HHB9708]KZT40502.1 hypothetical protein SISSUDRAFT_1044222 [Sistotremastrum suecicum HHB10207 ss-3]